MKLWILIFSISLPALFIFQNCSDLEGMVNQDISSNSQSFDEASGHTTASLNGAKKYPRNNPFFGIHYDLNWEVRDEQDRKVLMKLLRELNIGSIRTPIRWSALYETENTACEDLVIKPHVLDDYKNAINAIPTNIDVLVYLDSPPGSCRDLYKVNPEKFAEIYRSYVTEVVKAFKYRVKNWEIWNEQNNSHFYLASPESNMWSPWYFVKTVLLPGAAAVKAEDPNAKVIAGGVVFNGIVGHTPRSEPPVGDFRGELYVDDYFLIDQYNALDYFSQSLYGRSYHHFIDVIGTHPYYFNLPNQPYEYSPIDQTYGRNGTAEWMKSFGDVKSTIWWTEFGQQTTEEHHRLSNGQFDETRGEKEQANKLYSILTEAWKKKFRKEQALERLFYYSLRDLEVVQSDDQGQLRTKKQPLESPIPTHKRNRHFIPTGTTFFKKLNSRFFPLF